MRVCLLGALRNLNIKTEDNSQREIKEKSNKDVLEILKDKQAK